MSGGAFDYLQFRHEWDQMDEEISRHINENTYEFNPETLEEFRIGLEFIKKAKIYINRIDWLLSSDDSEESFHKRLKDDLEKNEDEKRNNL